MPRRVLKKILPSALLEQYRIFRHRIEDKRAIHRYSGELSFLSRLQCDDVSFSIGNAVVLGASLEHCIRIIKQHTTIKGKNILIIGCGKGEEIHRWVKERPASIIAIDFLDYNAYWSGIRYPNVNIYQADIRTDDIAGEFELVTSKAVLEHIDGLESAFPRLIKPLKDGGFFWADFGPLYYTWGGAHAPLNYDHLLLNEKDYSEVIEQTDFAEGKLFWQHGLFSRLTYDEYLSCFTKYLDKLYVGLEISEDGLRYREAQPSSYQRLLTSHKEQDLLLKGVFYLGRKK